MSQEELLRQIEEWNQAGQYWKIIHAVDALPPEERGYQLTCQQARACNNLVALRRVYKNLTRATSNLSQWKLERMLLTGVVVVNFDFIIPEIHRPDECVY